MHRAQRTLDHVAAAAAAAAADETDVARRSLTVKEDGWGFHDTAFKLNDQGKVYLSGTLRAMPLC